ncbi:hypothetical protein LTR49_028186 [Elasticomyces elasticus]|nr:hypothetical protein LTR49_028186 [Elasticomyces elasticus]
MMLPSIRYVEQPAALGHDKTRHDRVVRVASLRSNEQSPPRTDQDDRRDTVMQIPPVQLKTRTRDVAQAEVA